MQTLSQNITETLRDWILHGQMRPGERLEEVPLAEKLGVSRTPVRTALGILANEGLINHQPKRGYLVRTFEIDDIVAAYEVRSVLEGLACRSAAVIGLTDAQARTLKQSLAEGDRMLAAGALRPEDHAPYQQMNVSIHDTLIEASGNRWVMRFAEQAQNVPFASDRIVLWDDHPTILRSHGDHHRIVEAVIARDCCRAEQLMREHVYYAGVIFRTNYLKLLEAGDAPVRARHLNHAPATAGPSHPPAVAAGAAKFEPVSSVKSVREERTAAHPSGAPVHEDMSGPTRN